MVPDDSKRLVRSAQKITSIRIIFNVWQWKETWMQVWGRPDVGPYNSY